MYVCDYQRPKVLVSCKDAGCRQDIKLKMESYGYPTFSVDDIECAPSLLAENRDIKLVITDCEFKDSTMKAFLEKGIDDDGVGVSFIVLSEDSVERVHSAIDYYLTLPMNEDRLEEYARKCLEPLPTSVASM